VALAQQKKGGPYTKDEQRKRRDEVYKLHFEYGYSARKISEFLKINRGTINRDVMFLYADIEKKWRHNSPELFVRNQIERFQIQRTRLRKQLDTIETIKERNTIEKFIFDIDVKITDFQMRMADTKKIPISMVEGIINEVLYEQGKDKRVIYNDLFYILSKKAHAKIMKIYQEDRKF